MLLSYDLVFITIMSLSFKIRLGQGFYCLPCCKIFESLKVLLSLGIYFIYFGILVNCLPTSKRLFKKIEIVCTLLNSR